MSKEWFVYCLATVEEPVNTYIGATVDVDRRLAQHNGEKTGGAKCTSKRPECWYRVCYIQGFLDNHQALSFEWHWKYYSKKIKGDPPRTYAGREHPLGFAERDPLTRRQKGLDSCLIWFKEKHGIQLEVIYA
jgi:predicted GIY-YIG superfamily endonuclease